MAIYDSSGLEEIIRTMERLQMDEGPVAEEMVNAAVAEIKFQWELSAGMHGYRAPGSTGRGTGAMIESIGFGEGPIRASGIIYRDVYPHGKDKNGVRNAEKAYILHYGRSNMAASYWVDEAEENSQEPVTEAVQQIWDRFLVERGGG